MKYIDADKLKTEIERRAKFHDDAIKACIGLNNIAITHSAGWKEDTELLTIIDSLQQEQTEVDLEKEIEEHADTMPMCEFTHDSEVEDYLDWARKEFRHFYERGLNARKEE